MHIPPTNTDPFLQDVHILGLLGAKQVAQVGWHRGYKLSTQRPLTSLPTAQEVQNLLSPGTAQVPQDGSHGSQVPLTGLKAVPPGQKHTPLMRVIKGSVQPVQAAGLAGCTQVVQLGSQAWQIPYWSLAKPVSQAQIPSTGNIEGSTQDKQAAISPGIMQEAQSGPQIS